MAGAVSSQAMHLAREPLKLRAANKADLEAIASIVEQAFPDDPGCDYKFPYRDTHPDDFAKWVRLEYQGYLEQPEKYASLLVTAPVDEDGETVDKPIALGVWDLSPMVPQAAKDCHFYERRDMNLAHYSVYSAAMSRGFEDHFAAYKDDQIHLWMLMTHPDFRRRGAGTMLCNWGLKQARKRRVRRLTLMASPMGRALYSSLGYQLVASELAKICREDDSVAIDIMQLAVPRCATVIK